MNTENKIRRDLRALGNSGKRVAASLNKLGIKGRINNTIHCPIANYLVNKGYGSFEVDSEFIEPRVWKPNSSIAERLVVSKPISMFIIQFDKGRYPELDSTANPHLPK
jgi:hypothetical protein